MDHVICDAYDDSIDKTSVTLKCKLKSLSMPNLLHADTGHHVFEDRHPNLQLSTRLTNSNVDIKSYLTKKTTPCKSKLACGLEYLKSKLPRKKTSHHTDLYQRDKLDGLNKSHNKLLHPSKGAHTHHHYKMSPCIQRLTTDIQRSRSEDNLNSTAEDDYTHNYEMKRILSHDALLVTTNESIRHY